MLEKAILLAQSQTLIAFQTPREGNAILQPYTPLFFRAFALAANGFVCVNPNVPFKILVANKEPIHCRTRGHEKNSLLLGTWILLT